MSVTHENANLCLVECNSFGELQEKIAENALQIANTVSNAGTLYRQGGRYCFQTALDLQALVLLTTTRRPPKGAGPTSVAAINESNNRPLDQKHAKAIGGYVQSAVVSNRPYILPSVTLNLDQPVTVYALRSVSGAQAAVMMMPVGLRMEITDGQHRVEGIRRAVAEVPSLGADSIGAMVTFTDDHALVKQDFADCARTKAISPSMLTVYDRRNPANGLVMDLVEQSPLFRHTVDAMKQSISARSTSVWTTNQVRIMLKWALIGSQSSDQVFVDNATNILGERGDEAYKVWLEALLQALKIASEVNPEWRVLCSMDKEGLSAVPKIREESQSMLMTGTGLSVFGYLWFLLREEQRKNSTTDTTTVIRRIAALDWSAKIMTDPLTKRLVCSNELFRDNVKVNPERTQSGQKYVKAAGDLIWGKVCSSMEIS